MSRRVIIINTLLTLVLLIICDVVVGLLYNRLAPSNGRHNIDILLNRVPLEKSLNERPHPYLLWENTPEYVAGNGIRQTNKQGYRNEQDTGALQPDTLRILALGGSTTYGYLLDGPGDAWPAQLEKDLNEQLADTQYKRVEVINGGLNYATSAELLLHYSFRDRYLKSQVVILHTGENDIGPLLFDDYNPEYTHFRPGWQGNMHSLRRGERWFIEHSNIVKCFYACWLNDSSALPYINKQSKSFDMPEEYYIESVKKNQPIGFERNLELLIRNIIADGAMPVLVAPTFASERQLHELKGEAAQRASFTKNISKATVIGLEKDKAVLRRLSEQYRIPWIDIPSEQIPTEYFLDHIHLSREGEAMKASIISRNLLKLLPRR
jgi:lysophospholipase L1-like esterase